MLLPNLPGIGGFQFDGPNNFRDVFWGGSCDEGCMELAALLGWDEELRTLIAHEHQKLETEAQQQPGGEEEQKEVLQQNTDAET